MSLKRSYTLIAPVYDLAIAAATRRARAASLAPLSDTSACDVLLDGVGTGLDFPHLPPQHRYTALDLTRAMLERARPRARQHQVAWTLGDSRQLPFADAAFDCLVLHLIVAVVPEPHRALAEAARVTRPGGTLLVFDKFLRAGAAAPLRRLVNPIISRIATRTDVVFEDVLGKVAGLEVLSDEPALGAGWFRRIVLRKSY